MKGVAHLLRVLARDEVAELLSVLEDVRAVDDADGLVDRAERGGALHVHVDVAGDHRGDAVGIAAELARAEDLDLETHVGVGEFLLDDLRATLGLRLGVGVAVGEPQRAGLPGGGTGRPVAPVAAVSSAAAGGEGQG